MNRRCPSKRTAAWAAGLLLIGAVVNVAVAWAFVMQDLSYESHANHYSGYGWNWHNLPESEQQFWGYVASEYRRIGVHRIEVTRNTSFLGVARDTTTAFERIIPWWSVGALDVPELKDDEQEEQSSSEREMFHYISIVDARGWPLQSMWGVLKTPKSNQQAKPRTYWIVILKDAVRSGFPSDARLLPLRPLWPGFLINTVFYVAIAWLLFAAPRAVRRHRRSKRRQCPACGYPVGTSAVCTECGVAVKRLMTSVD